MKYIPCAFVNSNQIIKYGKPYGYTVRQNGDELTLNIVRDVFYDHPEAPESAMLTVTEVFPIKKVKPSDNDYSMVYLLLQAQRNIKYD